MAYSTNLDMYETYKNIEVDYGYPGNEPLIKDVITWFYGDNVSIEFDLTDLAGVIDEEHPIDPSFLLHKKMVVEFYNFRTELIKTYVFSYDKNEIVVTTDAIYVTVTLDDETTNNIFRRGTYYAKLTMANDLDGAETEAQTLLPLDEYTFEVK